MKLSDKDVLITSGTSGIGLAAAKLFRDEGEKVVVIGSNPQRIRDAERELGMTVTALQVDLRDPKQIYRAVAEVVEIHGGIDVVFANAAAATASPLEAVTREQIEREFALNFTGLFFTIQKAAPHMGDVGIASRHQYV